jgi:Txe/YoeB family toxin of Txe-Axe toxin-antitoxin module
MKRTEKSAHELILSVFEDPWHGASVKDILEGITFEQAFLRPIRSAHNIIELTLHISAWTEEILSRVNGNAPANPAAGDWPVPQFQTEEYWQVVKQNLFAKTNKLIITIKNFPEEKLDEFSGRERNVSLGTGFSYEGLIIGLVQHNAYHSGQISLIKKAF